MNWKERLPRGKSRWPAKRVHMNDWSHRTRMMVRGIPFPETGPQRRRRVHDLNVRGRWHEAYAALNATLLLARVTR